MVDNKAVVILMTLMSYRELTRYELSVKTKFSIKEIEERIGDLNHFLKEHHFPLIGISQSHYQISQELKEASEQIFEPLNAEQIYLSQAERINLIYLYTFCRKEFVSNTHYQDFLKVSKNTTLTDIKALRAKMANFGLALNYSCSTGYILVGPERQKHQLAMATISQPLTSSIGLWALDYVLASWNYPVSFERVSQSVKDYYQTFQMSPILDRLQEGLYAILFMACRYQRVKESVKVEPLLVSEQLQQLTTLLLSTILTDFEQPESYQKEDHHYFSLLLAGCFEGEGDVSDQFFDNLTVAIINQIQTVALLNFQQIDQLKTDLKRHLVPAYYRLRYGLPSHNDYTLRIKESYADLFDLVQQALQPLAQELNCPIPDSEISYFVLHFGGYLKTVKEASDKPYKAVIICPNGVSSSLIIKENLKVLFPEIAFQGISRIDQFV